MCRLELNEQQTIFRSLSMKVQPLITWLRTAEEDEDEDEDESESEED